MLSHYNPTLLLSTACDASHVGIGAVLFHTLPGNVEKPTAYTSRKLSKAEKNYAQIQKEALAIVYGNSASIYLRENSISLQTTSLY